jgi:low temperature requirement protein LtrA
LKVTNSEIWWGPPKKFSTHVVERKISWLELFYDLVYVIAISKITNQLATHPDFSGLLDYIYLFSMIFWGWFNGSMHHDLHGSPGIRTRFMTLWQMMIVAAMVVTLSGPQQTILHRSSISILVMQIYVTYLWWSVGIYDKNHRKLNKPYTICYLISFALIFTSLFLEQPFIRIIFYTSLILNYIPPLLSYWIVPRNEPELSLSSSMTERLGLFMIIIFGETVYGVVSGTIMIKEVSTAIWLNFGLGIIIVFALWWIFFSLIADRICRKGILNGHSTELAYILTLMALGMIGASFSGLFNNYNNINNVHSLWIINIFGVSHFIFLLGITLISQFLEYPESYAKLKRLMQMILLIAACIILLLTLVHLYLSLFFYLFVIALILVALVITITRLWFIIEIKNFNKS